MNDDAAKLEQAEEQILVDAVSDEALEVAAGADGRRVPMTDITSKCAKC